ncbi:YTH domain family protein, partial [Trifolium medium]|nr:YTH domain family protein [Trifolium medium]
SPPSDARSCVSSLGDASGSFKEGDVDHEYQFTDQNVPYAAGSYYGYYYPGYGGFYGEPENQGYYVGAADAVDFQYPWCWLGTLECAPLKVSGSIPSGSANFGGLVHTEQKTLALNGAPTSGRGIAPLG